MRAHRIGRFLLVSVIGGLLFSAHAQQFAPSCSTPPPPLVPILTAIEQSEPTAIDKSCGADGGSTQLGKQLESRAKNDFCAANSAVTITTSTLLRLQEKVTQDKKESLGVSRNALQQLLKAGNTMVGEGTKVQLAAYLLEAHFPKSNRQEG